MAKLANRSNKTFDIPILLITFNRVEPVEKQLKILREIRPSKIYISSDGPRNDRPNDIEKIKEVRSRIDGAITWDCSIEKTVFRKLILDANMPLNRP